MQFSAALDHITSNLLLYPACRGDNTVGYKVEVKPHPLKDVLEELYDLEGQHVLSNIVTNLEDTSLPNGRVTKRLREIA